MLKVTVSEDASIIRAVHHTYAFIPKHMQSTLHTIRIHSLDERAKEIGKTQLRGPYKILRREVEEKNHVVVS